MKAFDFQIYGFECEDYCNALVDRYGEQSTIAKILDANYDRLVGKSSVYVERLNEIRKFLNENGFEKEIAEQDTIFLGLVEQRTRKKAASLSERWDSDWK